MAVPTRNFTDCTAGEQRLELMGDLVCDSWPIDPPVLQDSSLGHRKELDDDLDARSGDRVSKDHDQRCPPIETALHVLFIL